LSPQLQGLCSLSNGPIDLITMKVYMNYSDN